MNTAITAIEASTGQEGHTSTPAESIIRLCGLAKTYGAVHAVNGIDLEIRRGETVALLGPNGAGKTTTISMLLGMLAPTRGSVEIFGMAPDQAIQQSRIGAMLQEGKLMPGVRVGELLDFVRSLHPHPLPKDQVIEIASLETIFDRRVDRLSGGQTQRVRFALAIAGDPEILVLDEPTAAMDVEARREFWASMRAYAAQGRTILFATHYLEEARTSASRLVIIAQGNIIADGPVSEIQARYGQPQVTFTCPAIAGINFERLPGVHQCAIVGQRVTLFTHDADATTRALVSGDLPWSNIEVKSSDLEDTFIRLVHDAKGA